MITAKKLSSLKRLTNKSSFENQATLLRCIGDETCLKILYVLSKEGEICVSDITDVLDMSMPAISHQLSKLKAMGIVKTKREGKTVCYSMCETKKADFVREFLQKEKY